MNKTSIIALSAILTACGANVTTYQADPADAGQGGADAAQGGNGGQGGSGGEAGQGGCQLQADCVINDGVNDICYEYKSVPLTACVIGDTLPCDGHEHCGPFGWCDPASAQCAAEGASTCLVDWVLTNCEASDEVCCETDDGVHVCSDAELCYGSILEP